MGPNVLPGVLMSNTVKEDRPHLHLVSVLEEVHEHVAPVTGHPPLWSRGGVQNQNSGLTLHTLTDAQSAQGVLAGRVGALVAAHT